MDQETINNNYKWHPPTTSDVENAHDDIRSICRSTAEHLVEYCPKSRELSIALTKVEEAMMWANAAIARNQ